ncbi:MAG: PEP/pyruvate-binding domain-containing protein [Nocardioides sp.]
MSACLLTPLAEATDALAFGGKNAQLAVALGAGLPVPGGYALSWEAVDDGVMSMDTLPERLGLFDDEPGPWAVRSSAVGEDSAAASFAGAHLSVLGVVGRLAVAEAIARVHASGNEPAARAYRERCGAEATLRMGVVVQQMVAADVAGVLFTSNPVTGVVERVVEASWGLGESVVSGSVTPDQYRFDGSGRLLGRIAGEKDRAIWLRADGTTHESMISGDRVDAFCLEAAHLADLNDLATACDQVFDDTQHDIEFAFADGELYLLQRRPITHG